MCQCSVWICSFWACSPTLGHDTRLPPQTPALLSKDHRQISNVPPRPPEGADSVDQRLSYSKKGRDWLPVSDARGGRCQISQTHQTGEQAFPPWLIQWQSRGGRQAGERSEEMKNDSQSGETDHSLFFCPLYCWAFFFCLGTDWGISLLPERRQSDEMRWALRNKKQMLVECLTGCATSAVSKTNCQFNLM